jgi:hypothetical protein
MRIKRSARIRGIRPEMVLGAAVVEGVLRSRDCELVITSGIDGRHRRGSLHYAGAALDIRSKTLRVEEKLEVVKELRDALGTDFDVILEGEGGPHEHIHIEYQPKGP